MFRYSRDAKVLNIRSCEGTETGEKEMLTPLSWLENTVNKRGTMEYTHAPNGFILDFMHSIRVDVHLHQIQV